MEITYCLHSDKEFILLLKNAFQRRLVEAELSQKIFQRCEGV